MTGVAEHEHNKQVVRRIVEEMFNAGKLDVADEIFSPEFVDRGHDQMAQKKGGPDGFANFVKTIREALPDINAAIQTMVAEGDYVARGRWKAFLIYFRFCPDDVRSRL